MIFTKYIESKYSKNYRSDIAKRLTKLIKNRHAIELIGMKRVGIANFLRFYLYNENCRKHYFGESSSKLFIPIDFAELVERKQIYVWISILQRILDQVISSEQIPADIKKEVTMLCEKSLKDKEIFVTYDSILKSLQMVSELGIHSVLFLIRFDRILDVLSPDFFTNMKSISESTSNYVTPIFTTYRSLQDLCSETFSESTMNVYTHKIFFKPVGKKDFKEFFKKTKYGLKMDNDVINYIYDQIGGYIHYAYLLLTILKEKYSTETINKSHVEKILVEDRRIIIQSEEIYDSLTHIEKNVLIDIVKKKKVDKAMKLKSIYLWNVGILDKENKIFSEVFKKYLLKETKSSKSEELAFTKKEHLLYKFLLSNKNEICTRLEIIKNVWPECTGFGVTDWTIDSLISRLRKKMKAMNSKYKINTVRTRGFKLVKI
ncbi:hypothetical protein GF362_05570 [Candidatus Dojkabacteria bacterium]|nr:hypothetical protein [Candidatus Dojkabacteria bacterium]